MKKRKRYCTRASAFAWEGLYGRFVLLTAHHGCNAWLRRGTVRTSLGAFPALQCVRPEAIRQLEKAGLDATDAHSKSWEEFSTPDSPHLSFVFTVCDNAANEVCPVWPGQPMTAHWGIP